MLHTANTLQLQDLIADSLDNLKAQDITILNVSNACSFTDHMIIATGTSKQHVKSIANHVIMAAKENDIAVISHEGEAHGEWVLIDLGDAVVHIMKPDIRDYYELEKLWSFDDA